MTGFLADSDSSMSFCRLLVMINLTNVSLLLWESNNFLNLARNSRRDSISHSSKASIRQKISPASPVSTILTKILHRAWKSVKSLSRDT